MSFASLEGRFYRSVALRADKMSRLQSLTGYVMGWCQAHGWSDLFVDHHRYWAFPPGAVMPLPVPSTVFQAFKGQERPERMKVIYGLLSLSAAAIFMSLQQQSPMPVVFAFSICALGVASFEESL